MALPAQADALAVVDSRRDLDLDPALLGLAAGARAILARRLDDLAAAPALRAGLRADDLAEEGVGDGLQPARPAAARARRPRRARRGAGAVAGRAVDHRGERDRALGALGRFRELDLDLGEDVRTAGRASRRPAAQSAEEIVAEECREEVAEVAEVEVGGSEPAGAKALVPVAVVELARLGLREDLVRLGRLAEALLGVRVVGDVRVQLARELAEGGLDRPLVRVPRDAEDLVVVARRGHVRRVLRPLAGTSAQVS